MVYEQYLKPQLQMCNGILHEYDGVLVPHHSVRDSVWVEFMLAVGLSDEELALAKRVYSHSL
jgi:hypothetical protein